MKNILITDDDKSLCSVLQSALTKAGYNARTVANGDEAAKMIEQGGFDLVLFTTKIMQFKVQQISEEQRLKLENELLKESLHSRFGPMFGGSECMRHVYDLINKVAPTSVPVLITGKSGTGKELVAHEIHKRSGRKSGPFIPINCVTLASELLESEIFGHEKGSFTGATEMKRGRFEIANEGTLFLDEVGELSDSAQVKLLRFLQEKEFERVGGNDVIKVDVRVIAATNRNLEQRIVEGKFREDLYYRLNMFRIDLPPLCERGEDIIVLTKHLLSKFNLEFGKNVEVSPEVLAILKMHDWPGNVRELENVIGQAVILADENNVVRPKHLPYMVAGRLATIETGVIEGTVPLVKQIETIESEIIRKTLEETNWQQSEAARRLGLKRSSLQYKVQKYGLTPSSGLDTSGAERGS